MRQRLADQGDPLAVDEDVGDVVVRRRDDAAALDQHGHLGLPSLSVLATVASLRRLARPSPLATAPVGTGPKTDPHPLSKNRHESAKKAQNPRNPRRPKSPVRW